MTEDTNGTARPRRRVLVIGLDGAPPELLFGKFASSLPNLRRLLERGVHALFRTTDPPVSVPAWPVMFTGVDPGTLGIYGFRHRIPQTYNDFYVPRSDQLPVPTLWTYASSLGYRVAVIGMPVGYPPPKLNGVAISDFLTPRQARDYVYPPELRDEIEAKFGPFPFDVLKRAGAREELYEEIVQMTRTHLSVAEDIIGRERWDLIGFHEVGSDRLHHAFQACFDPTHPQYVPGSPFAGVAEEYYRILDEGIGRLIHRAGEDVVTVVVSDHGSVPMHGCFCINDWLAAKGYLAFRRPPATGADLSAAEVDWGQTTAWGAGGYYARIFFNLRGRETHGIVDPTQVPAIRTRLEADLATVRRPDGSPFPVRVLEPAQMYHTVRGDAPDLMLYFDDLRYRSAGTVGHRQLFLPENDINPDNAVHGMDGVYLLHDPTIADGRETATLRVIDFFPTILRLLGEPIPPHVQGHVVEEALPRPPRADTDSRMGSGVEASTVSS
jgi:predicted AlkP superfamily phosphohydrolase/phosphomutase